jgi:hypothetical protein
MPQYKQRIIEVYYTPTSFLIHVYMLDEIIQDKLLIPMESPPYPSLQPH